LGRRPALGHAGSWFSNDALRLCARVYEILGFDPKTGSNYSDYLPGCNPEDRAVVEETSPHNVCAVEGCDSEAIIPGRQACKRNPLVTAVRETRVFTRWAVLDGLTSRRITLRSCGGGKLIGREAQGSPYREALLVGIMGWAASGLVRRKLIASAVFEGQSNRPHQWFVKRVPPADLHRVGRGLCPRRGGTKVDFEQGLLRRDGSV